jgi:hypothetical protein
MFRRISKISKFSLVAVGALALGAACSAQATKTATDVPVSKIDFYAGYGYLHPINSDINNYQYQDIYNFNVTSSLSAYFNRYLGVQVEGQYFSGNSPRGAFGQCRAGACNDRDPIVYTAEAGPIVRFPMGRWIPYAHAVGGGARVNGPILQKLTWGWGVTAGIGVDYVLPYWHNLLAIRPIQADWYHSEVNYGPLQPDGIEGGYGSIQAVKLSGGIVARFGAPSVATPVQLGCTTQPGSVFAGEPVVANASVMNLPAKRTPVYTWTTSGGKLKPNDSAATIDTAGLAPGDYVVSGHLTYGKKAAEQATCTAPFSVKAFEPPTVSCSANPSSVTSGGTVNISSTGMSPQNRPLTYSYSTTAGNLTGAGPTATLSTAGLGATTITITCNLVDDLGKTATANATVSVQALPVPPPAQTQTLCAMSFTRDKARPARVDNEAKGCLDDIALTMNKQTDAQLFVIGDASPTDKPGAAAERALNIRQYLTQEKGIDPSRIYVRTGTTGMRSAETVLVPAGATFGESGTQPFDENSIKRHGAAYGRAITKPAASTHHRAARTAPPA